MFNSSYMMTPNSAKPLKAIVQIEKEETMQNIEELKKIYEDLEEFLTSKGILDYTYDELNNTAEEYRYRLKNILKNILDKQNNMWYNIGN